VWTPTDCLTLLQGFLTPFVSDVRGVASSIVSSTIDVYTRACLDRLPTPNKFHYLFNMRDVVRVAQGIMSITPTKCTTSDAITRLWVHEVMRVFHDRLAPEDTQWFTSLVMGCLQRSFRFSATQDQVRHAAVAASALCVEGVTP
jgi:dynein heavy chain